jgi:dihydrofolate reductase
MRKLIVSEFITLDGIIQAPGGKEEDTDGGFTHGGWTLPYWHDDIFAKHFKRILSDVDAVLLGRRTYVGHAQAFEPDPANDPFANTTKYVVSRTIEKSLWRNTQIIRENPIEEIKKLKATTGGTIATDGSSQLVHALLENDLVDELHLLVYPIALGKGKRLFTDRVDLKFQLTDTVAYPTGVVGVHYNRAR